jgi:hypothetical protein
VSYVEFKGFVFLKIICFGNYFQCRSFSRFIHSHKNCDVVLNFKFLRFFKPEAVICIYEIDKSLINQIESELGKDTLESTEFTVTTKYNNNNSWSIVKINRRKFIGNITSKLGISSVFYSDV